MLQIDQLSTHYFLEAGTVKALDGASCRIGKGESLGIVGESGCGKSTLALSVLRLISAPGKITGGKIIWKGSDLLKFNPKEMLKVRGKEIAMIFQDPFTSLNPVLNIKEQIEEVFRFHHGKGNAQEALERVHLSGAKQRLKDYPHQFSGGERQRVMLAMALAGQPQLLIADEPTTALDVSIQKSILDLLVELKNELGLAILLITHDFGIVNYLCDNVAVMQEGKIIETGKCKEILNRPKDPYTKKLIDACRYYRK